MHPTQTFRMDFNEMPEVTIKIQDSFANCIILQGILLKYTTATRVGFKRLSDDTSTGRTAAQYLTAVGLERFAAVVSDL